MYLSTHSLVYVYTLALVMMVLAVHVSAISQHRNISVYHHHTCQTPVESSIYQMLDESERETASILASQQVTTSLKPTDWLQTNVSYAFAPKAPRQQPVGGMKDCIGRCELPWCQTCQSGDRKSIWACDGCVRAWNCSLSSPHSQIFLHRLTI